MRDGALEADEVHYAARGKDRAVSSWGLDACAMNQGVLTVATSAPPWNEEGMRRAVMRIALLASAALLSMTAAWIDEPWWTRHVVVPACYLPPPSWMLSLTRIGLAVLATLLALVAWKARAPDRGGAARIAIAVIAALVVSELGLRAVEQPRHTARHPRIEWLLGESDVLTGWRFVPLRTLRYGVPGGGPVVEYAVDAHGNRAPSSAFVEDARAPTLVVTGESMAVGHGLEWRDTFAAQAAERLGLQVVNVAEGGYGCDQALLRARDALARLQRPVALVSTVLPVQLHRNLNDARPHLELRDGALIESPAFRPRILLRELIVDDLQVLPEWRLQRALRLTRAILEATVREAQLHGARPLFVAPLFEPEPELVRELLEGLPHVAVRLAPERILPWDGHPDPRGARQIADAIVAALQRPPEESSWR